LENHYINPLLLNVEEEKLMKVKVLDSRILSNTRV